MTIIEGNLDGLPLTPLTAYLARILQGQSNIESLKYISVQCSIFSQLQFSSKRIQQDKSQGGARCILFSLSFSYSALCNVHPVALDRTIR